jgi:hypothetical protein
MSTNQTTAEKLKETWKKHGYNPYHMGSCWRNFMAVLMTYKGPSHFDLRAESNIGAGLISPSSDVKNKPKELQMSQIAKTGVHTPEDIRRMGSYPSQA